MRTYKLEYNGDFKLVDPLHSLTGFVFNFTLVAKFVIFNLSSSQLLSCDISFLK